MKKRVAYCGMAGALITIAIGIFMNDPFPNYLAPTIWLGAFYSGASILLFSGSRFQIAIGAIGVAFAAVLVVRLHFHPVCVLELCGAALFVLVPMFSETQAK
jgi:hypothetical protein